MKLSTKSRYGLRAVYCLAENPGETMSLAKIAAQTKLTEPYLEKLLAMLKKSEVVKTERGAAGGYTLSDSPDKISAGQVLRALEDDLIISDCTTTCASKCPNRFVFTKLSTEINRTLDNISIKDMLQENEERKK